ncbi:hypothetical protein BGW39_000507 [Mortierella sp. 14UC]|nr:hypothetical protein BGW39_000507 [Mortierella sp. 14UC]
MTWYVKAANQNDPDAQFTIGALHAYGQGVPQDDSQAIFTLALVTKMVVECLKMYMKRLLGITKLLKEVMPKPGAFGRDDSPSS